jgi:hypothetical protein
MLAFLVSCAGATPVDSSSRHRADDPCELSAGDRQRIGQLDADFERPIPAASPEPVSPDGYGYEFEDDPLGEPVDDGSCDCLGHALAGDQAPSCGGTLRAASLCLGGPGSQRLWAHRSCLPYRATTKTAKVTVELAQNGCAEPNCALLRVTVDDGRE